MWLISVMLCTEWHSSICPHCKSVKVFEWRKLLLLIWQLKRHFNIGLFYVGMQRTQTSDQYS